MSFTLPSSKLAADIATYGYGFTFTLGLIGHTFNLIVFSQRRIRSTSTGFLFLNITIFDICYLLMSLYDFLFINLSLPQTSPDYISLCRFRTFILNFVQTVSVWLLVCVAIDRMIRARFPHKYKIWCTRRNVLSVLFITIICAIAFNSHVLQSSFTTAFPFTRVICGPSRVNITDYTIFYYSTWPFLQICINILLPALFMIICVIGIYRKVRRAAIVRRNQHLQNQMLLLMLSKIILFLICTLPYGVYRMATFSSLDPNKTVEYSIFLLVTAILTIFLNANYSIAFYIHCLTSTLFRRTLFNTIKSCTRRWNTIRPIVHGIF